MTRLLGAHVSVAGGLEKAFELSEFSRQLFLHGLRRRFPGLPEEALMKVYRERLDKCHNRNY